MSAKKVIAIGDRFHRLVVSGEGPSLNSRIRYLCRCDCGRTVLVVSYDLRHKTKSCGCARRGHQNYKSHGMSASAEYKAWQGIHQRCENPKCDAFRNYGARGISVCERWGVFENFLEDMGRRPSVSHSLDRKNNDLGYSEENCRWATFTEQNRNTRRNCAYEFQGENLLLPEWAERLSIDVSTLRNRIRRGWTLERVFSASARKGTRSQ
jgi:hypothetical protein